MSMDLFPLEMESERLRYERLHPDDVDPFELYEYVRIGAPNIEEVTEYVGWDPYHHVKEAFDWVEYCGDQFEAGENATYLLRTKDGENAGELAGLTELHPVWDRQLATLGLWLRKPFWGCGYSGERTARLLELAFNRLDLEVVVVTHDPENDNSRRAIEKYVDRFGGRKEGRIRNEVVIDGKPRDSVRYSITSEEWKKNSEGH